MADLPTFTPGGPDDAVVAPRTPLEEELASLWQEFVAGDASPSVESDFFALGGDSLSAVRMLAAVDAATAVPVSFTDFLEAPTVAGLARIVEQAGQRPAEPVEPATTPAASDRARCSFAQERLWFLEELGGASAAYNMPIGVRIRGALDAGALERALQTLVGRHDALRTTFADEGGSPVQVIGADAELELAQVDLRECAAPIEQAQRLVDELAGSPLDLSRGPLVRAALMRVGEEEHVLELVFHHIICDGWSHVVVMRELGALYDAHANGSAPALPPPGVQYPEHARRERQRLVAAGLARRLEPWRERLADAPARLDLPTDRPRPAVPSYLGATHRLPVPDAVASAISDFARTAHATPFATMLAAYCILLSRYSGQDEIVVGATTAGRDGAKLDEGIGLFASTVALRADLAGEPSFAELVARVRDVVLWGVAHQDAPFEALVAALAPERDLSRHPLFQVFCAQVPRVPLPFGDAQPFDARPATSRFDLTLFVEEERDDQIELAWEYSTDLFDRTTIERMARQYLRLLESALADPRQSIDALALLDEDEEWEAVDAAGATDLAYPVATLHELFERHAAETPQAVAVIHEGSATTYAELNERADALAQRLARAGVGRGSLVALFLEPSVELVASILGVLKAGGAYVPLDPEQPTERARFVIADTAASVVVTHGDLRERLPAGDALALDVDDEDAGSAGGDVPATRATPEDLAYVIYTSGSTGTPKGVCVEHRNVARLLSATDAWFGFGPADTWVLVHSYAFDFSVWELWGALARGGRIVISPLWTTRSPTALAALVAEEGVTVLNATPGLFAAVQQELLARADDLALRTVVFGGEALQPAMLRPWFARFGDAGATLVNMYGITETTVHVTYRPLRAADCDLNTSPIGVAIPDLQAHVLDRRSRPVPAGVVGELYVGGAGVARGYLNRPELTGERFIANPYGPGRLYRTGDLARRRSNGELEFLGRIDDQVKVRGFRIELGEVIAAIREAAGVADAVVVAVEVTPGDTRLAAYVVADPRHADGDALGGEVLARLGATLPAYMVPASLALLERIPLTRNGKVDRRQLPAPTWETHRSGDFVAPQTPIELVVAEIWREILDIERVGAEDSFFNLGGHSLLAARVVTRVRERFSIALSVRALFDEPTLAGFSAIVGAAAARPGETARPAQTSIGAAPANTHPLAFAQQQLIFFDEMAPGSALYNAALATRVVGPLDEALLLEALAALFTRHEALRTGLVWGEATPAQIVREHWNVELPLIDLSGLGTAEREERLEQLLREDALRPFDLAADLMLRTTLFRLAPEEHVILFAPHHVAFDAWSVDILYRDLGELYAALHDRREPQLPELPRSYGDFARHQREHFQGETRAAELDFWRVHLAGAPTTLRLPTSGARSATMSFDGATHRFALDAALADAVRELAQELDMTPYMLLLAAFSTVLYRLGGQDDILVGGPMANRDAGGFDDVIGFFANTIVVRVRLAGNPSFGVLLERVRESVLRSYEHQDVPFELVVEALRPGRDPGINPLVQVNFRVRVGGPGTLELTGTQASQVAVDLGFARFDLALELHLLEDRVAGELTYNAALFTESAIARLAEDFETLVGLAVARPDTRLLSFPLSSAAMAVAAPSGIRGFRGGG